MQKKIRFPLPWYGVIPLASLVLFNQLVYDGARLLNKGRVHYDLSIPFIDENIPFVPAMMFIYVLSYAFWAIGYVVVARESREVCYRVFSGDLIAKSFCLVIFLCLPTVMNARPSDFPVETLADRLTRLIFDIDSPDNLFPSIHCLESWMVFRGSTICKKVPNGYRIFCLVFALTVCLSTVMVKQHVVADIFAGIALAELGLFLSKRLRTGRLFEAINRRLEKRHT